MNFQNPNQMIVGGGGLPAARESDQFFFAPEGRVRSTELSLDDSDGRVSLPTPQRPYLVVGRSDRCDVVLDHEDVSFRHAYLQLIGGHVYCVDLSSRRGTYWDGKRKASGWMNPSVPVSIGPFTISSRPPQFGPTMATGLLDEDLLSTDSFERYPGCQAELTFLNGRSSRSNGQKWRIRQPITLVGNASRCRMRLSHDSVSRVHCSLMVTPNGLWVADLLGKSGTWVNEEPVDFRLLQHGDEIRVGDFRFAVSYDGVAAAKPASVSPAPEFNKPPNQPPDQPQQQAPSQRSNQQPGGGLSEEFMLSMMDRFSAMQQQMTTMSHQQMMVMTQLIGTMHQNHHDLVQQEMARIHQIDDQIKELQTQVETEMTSSQQPSLSDSTIAGAISFVPESEPPVQLPSAPVVEEFPTQPDPAPATPTETAENPSQSETGSPDPRRDRTAPRNAESHSELIERMAALQGERTSRWKKVMQILTGSGP